jgi:hypothetical protein
LRLDDHNVRALLGLANAHMWEVNMYVSDDREAQIRAAEAAAARRWRMNRNAADVHVTYGTVLFAMRDPNVRYANSSWPLVWTAISPWRTAISG